jgi:predicted TIM-barrel fold metal-dependent hydrolase
MEEATTQLSATVAGAPAPCLASAPGLLREALPGVHDVDGPRLPTALPAVIDAHVHLFPDRLFAAIWRWFDAHGWPVRYPFESGRVIEFLLSRGVERIVALHYAHEPGMARALNRYVASLAAADPRVVGTATVFPGEEDTDAILEEAFALGLRGVKMHCHVQCFAPDEARLEAVYRKCAERGLPLVMHAGREPKSPAYACDPHLLCAASRVEEVLRSYPGLRLVVPHLGADEFDAYGDLMERFDNLWLDTTMALAGYLPGDAGTPLVARRPGRVLYGTDFPNIPYAWDREVRILSRLGLGEEELATVLGGNARDLWGL